MTPLEKSKQETLVGVFYILLRNHLPSGKLYRTVFDIRDNPPPYAFSNKYLEQISRDVVKELFKQDAP